MEESCLPVVEGHVDEHQNEPSCTSSINCDDKETNQGDTEGCSKMTDAYQLTENDPDETEKIDDPQNRFRASVNQKCLESFVPDYPVKVNVNEGNNTENDSSDLSTVVGNEMFSIVPGEGKHPVHFMQDKNCKELASLFCFLRENFVMRLRERSNYHLQNISVPGF